jgi:predicted branched-subunit amino acid permease
MKGLRYGTAIALLWEIAMLEGVALFGNSLQDEWMVGLSDAVPVFVLSVLLSRLQTDKESVRPTVSAALQKWEAVAVFTGIFLTGRYIAYLSELFDPVSNPGLFRCCYGHF